MFRSWQKKAAEKSQELSEMIKKEIAYRIEIAGALGGINKQTMSCLQKAIDDIVVIFQEEEGIRYLQFEVKFFKKNEKPEMLVCSANDWTKRFFFCFFKWSDFFCRMPFWRLMQEKDQE
jgi:hypothetical protein